VPRGSIVLCDLAVALRLLLSLGPSRHRRGSGYHSLIGTTGGARKTTGRKVLAQRLASTSSRTTLRVAVHLLNVRRVSEGVTVRGNRKQLRRRIAVSAIVVFVLLVLAFPLWSGYFGPKAVAYVQTWRPWRTHLVIEDATPPSSDRTHGVLLQVNYNDAFRDSTGEPAGPRVRFLMIKRSSSLLPWRVTESGTGP